MTKVALWEHLHTDSRSLSIANCIQAEAWFAYQALLTGRWDGHSRLEPGQCLRPNAISSSWLSSSWTCLAFCCHLRLKPSHWSFRAKLGHAQTVTGSRGSPFLLYWLRVQSLRWKGFLPWQILHAGTVSVFVSLLLGPQSYPQVQLTTQFTWWKATTLPWAGSLQWLQRRWEGATF